MNCMEVMTPDPMCCTPSTSIVEAAGMMRDQDVGPLPVVESEGSKKLIGIVTDRDIVVKLLAQGADMQSATVEQAMTADPVCCRPEDDVHRALDAMSEHQVRRIPIVDEGGAIVGIIAQADIALRLQSDKETGDVVEDISERSGKGKAW